MKRIKNLIFRTYQSFTEWYMKMTRTFKTLRLEFLKAFKNSSYVAVVISH